MSRSIPSATPQTPGVQDPPPDRAMGIIKLIFALGLIGVGGYLTFYNLGREHKSYIATAVILGIILGAGVRLLLTGGAQARGRRFALVPSLIVFLIVGAAVIFIFPRAYKARVAAAEQESWNRLQASPKAYNDYKQYTDEAGDGARPGARPAMALARVREELAKPDGPSVSELRWALNSARHDKDKTGESAFQEAIDLARKGLAEAYARALADLGERLEADTTRREFPEDPQMRAAFAAVITQLAKADDDYVYLDFSSDNQLVTASPARADAKEIAPGEAFSSERDSRRRSAFSSALTDSLSAAFKGQTLIRVQDLQPGAVRKGKVIFQAKCTTRRIPGSYVYTVDDKEAGTLFKFEVDWQFNVIDADGKTLATNRSRSNPATSISFSTRSSDPPWAPYSVLMDSAYYNYCRQITGRLGLIPPPVKESFTFSR